MNRRAQLPRWVSGAVALVLIALWLLWPGDVPWINDEPSLLIRAHTANQEGRLAEHGLSGSVGITYGPLAT